MLTENHQSCQKVCFQPAVTNVSREYHHSGGLRKACVVQQSLEALCPNTKVWVGLHSLLCFGCIIIRVL